MLRILANSARSGFSTRTNDGGAEFEGEIGLEADHAEAFVEFDEIGMIFGELAKRGGDVFWQGGTGRELRARRSLYFFWRSASCAARRSRSFLRASRPSVAPVEGGESGFELGDFGAGVGEVIFGFGELGHGLAVGGFEALVFALGDAARGGEQEEGEEGEDEDTGVEDAGGWGGSWGVSV